LPGFWPGQKSARYLTDNRQHEILETLTAAALWVVPVVKVEDCRDAKDNCYLELALAARATASSPPVPTPNLIAPE
jgi:predicted nucleic acid-binding protein